MNVTFEKAQTKIMMKVDGKTHLLDPSANIVPLTGADEYEIRTNTGEVYRQNQKDVSVPAHTTREQLFSQFATDFFFSVTRPSTGRLGSFPCLSFTGDFTDGEPTTFDMESELEIFMVSTIIDGKPLQILDAQTTGTFINVTLNGNNYLNQKIYLLFFPT